MLIGGEKKRITIQQPADTQDAYGAPVPAWSTVTTVWAQVEPLRGSEYLISKQTGAKIDTRFVIRYRVDIYLTPKMKVVYDGNDYNIESIININEANKELHLMCNRFVK